MGSPIDEQRNASEDVAKINTGEVNTVRSMDKHLELVSWVAQQGGFIHPDIEIVHDHSKGFHLVLDGGKSLPARTVVTKCPMSATLSVLNVLNIAPFENHGTEFPTIFLEQYQTATHVLQAFYLMEQYVLGEKSWWASYITTLPDVKDIHDLQFESKEDIIWIRGTELEFMVADESSRRRSSFEQANHLLRELGWDHAVNGAYSYELFSWASTIFGSRSFVSDVLGDTRPGDIARPLGSEEPEHQLLASLFSTKFAVLLPLFDIASHNPSARADWSRTSDCLALLLNDDVQGGQEVFNNYGVIDNTRLLMAYGFVLEANPFDQVTTKLHVHPGDRLATARTWPRDDRSDENYSCLIFGLGHYFMKRATWLDRDLFSYDLLDTMSVVSSNDREFGIMIARRKSLMSTCLPSHFEDHRNVLATFSQILFDVSNRADLLILTDPAQHNPPKKVRTQKQQHAQIYRRTQIEILQDAIGACTFSLLNACFDQKAPDLLLNIQTNLPGIVLSPKLVDTCNRLPCLTRKNELFTPGSLLKLLPSATANGIRSCVEEVERAIDDTRRHQTRTHMDKVRTAFTLIVSALCLTHRSRIELPARLVVWIEELTSSYPPEDPAWNYVPPPEDEPEAALMFLLEAFPKVAQRMATDNPMRSWLELPMGAWAWNVMQEEGVWVPSAIERFVSDRPAQGHERYGFLMYCKGL